MSLMYFNKTNAINLVLISMNSFKNHCIAFSWKTAARPCEPYRFLGVRGWRSDVCPTTGDYLQGKSQHDSSSLKGQAFLVQIPGAPHGTPEQDTLGNRTPQISLHGPEINWCTGGPTPTLDSPNPLSYIFKTILTGIEWTFSHTLGRAINNTDWSNRGTDACFKIMYSCSFSSYYLQANAT